MSEENESKEIQLTEEDKVISLEGITRVEKHFLNLVRNFKSQEWLAGLIADNLDEIISSLVNKTAEDEAIREVVSAVKLANTDEDNAYNLFFENYTCIMENEEFVEEKTNQWLGVVMETLDGELKPTE